MERIGNASITEIEAKLFNEAKEKIFWPTHLSFLKQHNGFRPGNVHVLLGTSSGGKSTLVRSIIFSTLAMMPKDKKILLWLSEESKNDFRIEFHRSELRIASLLEKLYLVSEIDELDDIGDARKAMNLFKEVCAEVDLVIFDNITTSILYNDLKGQGTVVSQLKKIAERNEVPLLLIAHTGSEVNNNINRLITMNDIRGNKTLVNLSQFFYIMQSFNIENDVHNTITVTKHRGQDCDNFLYSLHYDKIKRMYDYDVYLTFPKIKELHSKRNKL